MAHSFPSLCEEIEIIPERTLRRKRMVEGFRDSKRARTLRLMTGAYCLAKEDEDYPLGQDAYFICGEEQTFGVADGVGGWAKWGIDSGVYAGELMDNAAHFVQTHCSTEGVDPMCVLDHAFENSNAQGASTACIITLKDNALHAVNLGDSGFMVIRREEVAFKSTAQQSRFNCPFQLGATTGNTPAQADEITFEVERGDVLVAATDGLFDNVFETEIEGVVSSCLEDGDPPEVMAFNLGAIAREISLLEDTPSPFTVAAIADGLDRDAYLGGKYDDVTVVVGYVI